MPKSSELKQKWYVVDAKGKVLGRLAVEVAKILYGKHKSIFRRDLNTGDGVIVINAAKIRVTGKKLAEKTYKRFSGYPDGLKIETLETVLKKKPKYVIIHAVKGMLPKNKVGKAALMKLKVYEGAEHPHSAQKPEPLKI
ncbi:MAG: 50S ribosomal protein L13 [Omnitrophica WOR_2 bacterium SM23_29]|nr:MAG: 50S ribosomal protein L13 [Omnitrophica WOR_2 bacterium SM23_29]